MTLDNVFEQGINSEAPGFHPLNNSSCFICKYSQPDQERVWQCQKHHIVFGSDRSCNTEIECLRNLSEFVCDDFEQAKINNHNN